MTHRLIYFDVYICRLAITLLTIIMSIFNVKQSHTTEPICRAQDTE
jgi:hypothetical protein